MNNKKLLIGFGILAVIGAYLYWKKKSDNNTVVTTTIAPPTNNTVIPTAPQGEFNVIRDSANCVAPLSCPIIGADVNGFRYYKKNDKYFKIGTGESLVAYVPVEITAQQWMDECISKLPM